MRAYLISFAVLFGLAGCAGPQSAQSRDLDAGEPSPDLAFFFLGNRELSLEPCGCSVSPLGGLVREWNLLQTWRGSLGQAFYFGGGNSLMPSPFQAAQMTHYRKKSEILIEAMNLAGFSAFSPNGND